MQKLIERSLKQQEKLQHMLANVPSGMHKDVFATHLEQSSSRYLLNKVVSSASALILAVATSCLCFRMLPECFNFSSSVPEYNECELKIKEEPVAAPKVKLLKSCALFRDLVAFLLHESFDCCLNLCFL